MATAGACTTKSNLSHRLDTNYSQRVLTRADSGRVLSQVALIFRAGHWNSTPLRIGGIAGVGTDPKFRGQGLATVGMKRATEILVEEGFDIGALFCAPEMVPFYERLGWRRYDGAVFIKQPGNNHIPWSIGTSYRVLEHDLAGGRGISNASIQLLLASIGVDGDCL